MEGEGKGIVHTPAAQTSRSRKSESKDNSVGRAPIPHTAARRPTRETASSMPARRTLPTCNDDKGRLDRRSQGFWTAAKATADKSAHVKATAVANTAAGWNNIFV
jgi:hypothetical protein